MDSESIIIREARQEDYDFVVDLMDSALKPYYGGDHGAHARRILSTHLSGGVDTLGHFSLEQRMFILVADGSPSGMVHLVFKRQGTCKISPLLVSAERRKKGFGTRLLSHAEAYAISRSSRQIYATVALQNREAAQFFITRGYIPAGRSDSHYKLDVSEIMIYKMLQTKDIDAIFDRPNISVVPMESHHELMVRRLLLSALPEEFNGINDQWVDALFAGYRRIDTRDVNQKFKVIYVALDRKGEVLGVAGATPKKGEPIKLMPFISTDPPSFLAMLTDLPYLLREYGRKVYIHINPTLDQVIALQQRRWKLDAALPAAYHPNQVTQQWSLDIDVEDLMRNMRVKQEFLNLIRRGKKTLEVRVGYPSMKSIVPGERIKMMSRADEQVVRVNDVRRYDSFDLMLQSEDASKIAPPMDKDQVLRLLKEIYPREREMLGVVVLDIQAEI